MKTKYPILVVCATIAAGVIFLQSSWSRAQEPNPKDPYKKPDAATAGAPRGAERRNLSFHVEDFSLSLADAAAFLREPRSDEERYAEIVKLVEEGKAHQETLMIMRGVSGQRFVTESIDEWRYGAEFEPPQFEPPLPAPKPEPKPGVAPAPEEAAAPPQLPAVSRDRLALMEPTPTAFETRNIGETVEIEPVLSPDEKVIDLNLVPQLVRYLGEREAVGAPFGQRRGTAVFRVHVPLFQTQKLTTSVAIEPGKPYFLGTKNQPSDNGLAKDDPSRQIWFSFITSFLVTPGGNALSDPPETVIPERSTAPFRGEESPALVSLRFEDFSLSLSDAAALMRTHVSDAERLRQVLKMVTEGKAREEQLAVVRTKSGQRMVAESINELRYATEFEPDTVTILDAQKAGGKVDEASGGAFEGQVSGGTVSPTAFETRNTGETIEVEPVINQDGKTIYINLVPQVVRYFGEHPVSLDPRVEQPTFETQKITTSVTIEAGKPFLLGTSNLPPDDGVSKSDPARRIWLTFVSGDLVTAGGVAIGAKSGEASGGPSLKAP